MVAEMPLTAFRFSAMNSFQSDDEDDFTLHPPLRATTPV